MSVNETAIEEHNRVPIAGRYDVIVVGGGVAGTAAAIAASRIGCSTLLVEKSVMLGGLATLGCIAIYLPLCDGRGRKLMGGLAEELLKLSVKYGYSNIPPEWIGGPPQVRGQERYCTVFSPPEFVLALDEIAADEGVKTLFDTVVCKPVMEGNRCRAVVVENKSGRSAFVGRCFVDASGDADLAFRAGLKCVESDNWLSYWLYSTSLESMGEAARSGRIESAILLEQLGADSTGRGAPDWARKYRGTDGWEVTEFVLAGRRMARDKLLDALEPTRSYLAFPAMAQLRTTRRIAGRHTLTGDDLARWFPDSIGCVGDWRRRGEVYEIPYRCLAGETVGNILVAGRCIATEGEAWEACRVIAPAALTGEAAGIAAALSVQAGCAVQNIDVKKLQKRLADGGTLLHAP